MGLGEFFELTSIQGASFLPRLLLPSVRSLVGAYVVVALVYSLVVVVVVLLFVYVLCANASNESIIVMAYADSYMKYELHKT